MLFWIFVTVLLAAMGVGLLVGYRYVMTGDLGFTLPNWFAPKPEPRLGVSEQIMVDSRRRLVLIRRDDVEHLVMTGGPVDVVIETGIAAPMIATAAPEDQLEAAAYEPTLAPEEPVQPVFTRKPRTFGQAVNE